MLVDPSCVSISYNVHVGTAHSYNQCPVLPMQLHDITQELTSWMASWYFSISKYLTSVIEATYDETTRVQIKSTCVHGYYSNLSSDR